MNFQNFKKKSTKPVRHHGHKPTIPQPQRKANNQPLVVTTISLLQTLYKGLIESRYQDTTQIQDRVRDLYNDYKFSDEYEKSQVSFRFKEIISHTYVDSEYAYLSMPNGQCGAYACAVAAFINSLPADWISTQDHPIKEGTGVLTERTGVPFYESGRLGYPCARGGHAYICVQVPLKDDEQSVHHYRNKQKKSRQVHQPKQQTSLDFSKKKRIQMQSAYNDESVKTHLSLKLYTQFLEILIARGEEITKQNIDDVRTSHNRYIASVRNVEGHNLIKTFFTQHVKFTDGATSESVAESLDLAMRFGSIKSYAMKKIVIETLTQEKFLNVTEFKGDNRYKKILPLLYQNVQYKQVTIDVPTAAKNSDIGLPDFDKIQAVIPRVEPKQNLVGSISAMQFKEEIRIKGMVRFDHLIKNFNMNIAASNVASYNHNNPNQDMRSDMRTLYVPKPNSSIMVNSAGSLSSHLLNEMLAKGMPVKNHDNNRILTSNSSSHPAPRTIADLFASNPMKRVIEKGKNFLKANPQSTYYIIDIGAKYAKHASLYYKALFEFSDRVCYIGVRPDLDDYDRRYNLDNNDKTYPHYASFRQEVDDHQVIYDDLWLQDLWNSIQNENPHYSRDQIQDCVNKAKHKEDQRSRFTLFSQLESDRKAPAWFLRNISNWGSAAFWAAAIYPYAFGDHQVLPSPGRVNVFRGTIQEFNLQYSGFITDLEDNSVTGISLDSAYYLSDIVFPYPIDYSFMTFPCIVGKWQLPSNQGTAAITIKLDENSNAHFGVSMQASGQARPYTHPLVVPVHLNETFPCNGIVYHSGFVSAGEVAFRAVIVPREVFLEEYCDNQDMKRWTCPLIQNDVIIFNETQMRQPGIRKYFGCAMSEWKKKQIIVDRVRQLNLNMEVNWTAVCAHLYTFKDAVTSEQIEKSKLNSAILEQHLKAFGENIKCMEPLIRIRFDQYSMARNSLIYRHFKQTLPFLVGYTQIEPKIVSYKTVSEIGIWDWHLGSSRDRNHDVQVDYHGPMVSGFLNYELEDLKTLSAKLKKTLIQQHLQVMFQALSAQLEPHQFETVNDVYHKYSQGIALTTQNSRDMRALFSQNPKLLQQKLGCQDTSQIYYCTHVFKEVDMTESRAVINEIWHKDKQHIYDLCRNEKPDFRIPYQSGFTIQGMRPYEWSNRSRTNLLYSMSSRLLSARSSPDPEYLIGFKAFVQPQIDKMVSNIELYFKDVNTNGYKAWLDNHPNWGKQKKILYERQILKQLKIAEDEKFHGHFEVMAKNGEQHLTKQLSFDENKRCTNEETRIRPIQNPKGDYVGLMTWTNEFHIEALKNATPQFISGMNGKQFKEMYTECARSVEDCIPCSADGSSFDSTQWAELIEIVDNYYYKRVWPILTRYFGFSQRVSNKLLEFQLDQRSKIKYKWENQTFLTQTISGTTPSGHPTRTTVGNTLRTIMYFNYWMHQSGCLDEIPLYDYKLRQTPSDRGFKLQPVLKSKHQSLAIVAGDDAVVLLPGRFKQNLQHNILEGSVRDSKVAKVKGIGGCYKEVLFGNSWVDMEFCSKKCFAITSKEEGESVIVRDFIKSLGTSNFYTGSNRAICQNPFQHSYLIGSILLSEVGPRLNKAIGVARIRMGEAWDITESLANISLHRMMLDQFQIGEELQNRIDDYQMQSLQITYQQYVDLAIHATGCSKIGDVINLPCDIIKPDTFVSGFRPSIMSQKEKQKQKENKMNKTKQKTQKTNQNKIEQRKIVSLKVQRNQQPQKSQGLIHYKENKDMYAQSVLMPESTQGGRIPSRFAIPTATLQHYEKFDIKTNNLGQALVCMHPSDTQGLALLENSDDIDIAKLSNYKSGKVMASITTEVISKYRVVSAVLKFHFTQNALKKQGSRTIALVPGKTIFLDPNGKPSINHSILEKCVYHETSDLSQSARMIWLPMDPADNIFQDTETGAERDAAYVAMLFTGCVESEHIGYAEMTVNLEYIPRLDYWNTVVRQLVPSDSQIQDKVESVLSNNPALASKPLVQMQKLWSHIKPHLISTAITVAKAALSA